MGQNFGGYQSADQHFTFEHDAPWHDTPHGSLWNATVCAEGRLAFRHHGIASAAIDASADERTREAVRRAIDRYASAGRLR